MKVQADVFIDTENPGPKRIVGEERKIPGVVRADALFVRRQSIRMPSSREFGTRSRMWFVGSEARIPVAGGRHA
jgi:hypothetical protein